MFREHDQRMCGCGRSRGNCLGSIRVLSVSLQCSMMHQGFVSWLLLARAHDGQSEFEFFIGIPFVINFILLSVNKINSFYFFVSFYILRLSITHVSVICCCNLSKVVRYFSQREKNAIFKNFPINQLPLVHFLFFWNGYLLSFVLNFLRLNLWLFVEIFNNTFLLNIIFSYFPLTFLKSKFNN